ncbi:hypothetical protein [Natrinema hispanicum]|uniref:STAS/SEC14 domain-containing protein n=1 Tax=Natrinema hispanicum TaxID=392421 RepID=A0A1I0DM88_9EURY|nr:hypothetical protein [Natrinema hispanicum]SDC84045.1 hypothetical protein SAMN05192552_100823 [Natrinema hispanicum]SET33232.1 hypothetical protein SAMN04488694_105209 [Natrinema hispanicum]
MYTIERTDFGFQITFAGKMDEAELHEWINDSRAALQDSPDEFGVLVDMRDLKLLNDDEQQLMRDGQQHYQDAGMVRSSVILDSAILTLQFRRLAKESGIYDWERYINAGTTDDWYQQAVDWLVDEIDPDYQ